MRSVGFTTGDRAPAVAAVDQVRSTGQGWVNLSPAVPDEARTPPPSAFGRFFSARGPAVPLITLSPEPGRGSATATAVGIAHGHNERLRPWLATEGLLPPPEWVLKQDHARRGAVWEIGPDIATEPVVSLLVEIGTRLCPIDTRGRWVAEIH